MRQSSPPDAAEPPVEVRVRHIYHQKHGGAWKVAYADFVTALLALFIVLWLMGSSAKVKASVSEYFKDPQGYITKLNAKSAKSAVSAEEVVVHRENVEDIQKRIEQALAQMPEFRKLRDNIKFSVSNEGLRIDLVETEQGLFFVTGSPVPTRAGERLLAVIAKELGKMPNAVVIEGHTDARPFRNAGPSSGYGNFELSADRANAARRLLHTYGVRPEQAVEVRGFAQQKLLNPADPNDPRNRRISLVVKFVGDAGR
jgi:chemotaxis protein MotB